MTDRRLPYQSTEPLKGPDDLLDRVEPPLSRSSRVIDSCRAKDHRRLHEARGYA